MKGLGEWSSMEKNKEMDFRSFENKEFGNVRVLVRDNEPWFVAADVCRALEIANLRDAMLQLDDDEKGTSLINTPGGYQEMIIINETGLYSLVLDSRKPEAKAFKRWITHEVIPAICKYGIYAMPQIVEEMLADPDAMIQVLQALKAEYERNEMLAEKVEEDKPYVDFAYSIATTSDSIHVGDFAELVCDSGINIGRNRLFDWLRNNGYLMEDDKPYQRHVYGGLFSVKEHTAHTVCGDRNYSTTLITGKGQLVLMEALRNEFGMIESAGVKERMG